MCKRIKLNFSSYPVQSKLKWATHLNVRGRKVTLDGTLRNELATACMFVLGKKGRSNKNFHFCDSTDIINK